MRAFRRLCVCVCVICRSVEYLKNILYQLLHYKLQVIISKTTWVKVLQHLMLTVLKYFTCAKYRLKETRQSNTVTLWRSWRRQRLGSICRQFMEKLQQIISQKPKGTKNRMTVNHYIQQLTKNWRNTRALYLYIYIHTLYCQKLITKHQWLVHSLYGQKYWHPFFRREKGTSKLCQQRWKHNSCT